MLTTQLLDAGTNGFLGVAGFGAIASTPATASLQAYLNKLGKLPKDQVNGTMNDATMAVIFNLLIETAAVVGKIPLLPVDVRDGINKVVTALKDADNKLKSLTFGQVGLSFVIQHFTDATAVARLISESAANGMLSVRDTVYNAVAGQSTFIQKAFQIFFPAGSTTPGAPGTAVPGGHKTRALPSSLTNKTTVLVKAAPVKPGTVYAFSKKLGKYRIAVPKTIVAAAPKAAGFAGPGGLGIMRDGALGGECIFGDCGLGQDASATFTETAPSTTQPTTPARQVTESELEKLTGTTPFYKKPLFWALTVGGVAAVGGGYWYVKRRKSIAPARAA